MSLKKNAKQNVECTIKDLRNAKCSLENALETVEKNANRSNIEDTLNTVSNALCKAEETIENYVER